MQYLWKQMTYSEVGKIQIYHLHIKKLYNYTTAAKSQMAVSTAVNNLIRNDPYVKIIYTNASWFTDS
jgi:hypothetical protein